MILYNFNKRVIKKKFMYIFIYKYIKIVINLKRLVCEKLNSKTSLVIQNSSTAKRERDFNCFNFSNLKKNNLIVFFIVTKFLIAMIQKSKKNIPLIL